jgi:hypothetical protein
VYGLTFLGQMLLKSFSLSWNWHSYVLYQSLTPAASSNISAKAVTT